MVANGADFLVERANHGHDLVNSNATHVLSSNFKDLTLVGSAIVTGTGNGLANRIKANKAASILIGGNGVDIQLGAGGADSFAFLKTFGSPSVARDMILDFTRGRRDVTDGRPAMPIPARLATGPLS